MGYVTRLFVNCSFWFSYFALVINPSKNGLVALFYFGADLFSLINVCMLGAARKNQQSYYYMSRPHSFRTKVSEDGNKVESETYFLIVKVKMHLLCMFWILFMICKIAEASTIFHILNLNSLLKFAYCERRVLYRQMHLLLWRLMLLSISIVTIQVQVQVKCQKSKVERTWSDSILLCQ